MNSQGKNLNLISGIWNLKGKETGKEILTQIETQYD